jgi:dTDP-4-amino-4,6-dideoxygalactose transaminase
LTRGEGIPGAPPSPIPVLRPQLPKAERLAPWLKRIDEARWYSNFGPLEREFRAGLGHLAGLSAEQVALFSSGASALAVGLRALSGSEGGLCLMPAWTHVGTACAARAAGLEPFFLDCYPETWAIDPAAALRHAGGEARAVVPVAPFGSRIDYAAWDRFSRETGLAVVIDAAAGFDQFVNFGAQIPWGRTPVMVSLHATKAFGVGEGGVLLTADEDLARRGRQLSNFGIGGERPIDDAFGNYKMSEYSAAVGLAALEGWPERRSVLARLADRMAEGFERIGVRPAPGFGGEFVSSTCMIQAPCRTAEDLEQFCAAHGVGTRRWWRAGVHLLPAFERCRREPLVHTAEIASAFLGVGYYPGMTEEEFARVLNVLEAAARELKPSALLSGGD